MLKSSLATSSSSLRGDTPGVFHTATDRPDTGGVVINIFYKYSRLKQYKGRAGDADRGDGQHAP